MQSLFDDPSNPWPHDMVLRIDDHLVLEYLLFVRAAWGLDVHEVGPSIPIDVGASRMPVGLDERIATVRWLGEWNRSWADLADIPDFAVPDFALLESPYFTDGVDRDAFDAWREGFPHEPEFDRLEDTPERMSLPALIAAWRTGLTTITELPFMGGFAQRVSAAHLVVAFATRRDPATFTAALGLRPGRGIPA